MTIETRVRQELIEPIPEGFRFLHNTFDEKEGVFYTLVTNAPADKMPWEGERRWLPMRQIVEQREVTDWVEVNDG